ncbi:MAG TPA: DMT family transporter [Sphingobium sp.]
MESAARRTKAVALPVAFAACCIGVALFSWMDGAMKALSIAIGVYNALLWRAVTGTTMGIIGMAATHTPWPGRIALKVHMIRGTVVAFMATLFFLGLRHLPMAEAIALSFVAPLIALYLAAVLLKERIGRSTIIGSLLGLAGIAVILSARLTGHYDPNAILGALCILGSAILFAWNLILQKQQAGLAVPIEVAFFQNLVLLILFAIPAPFLAIIPQFHHIPMILLATGLAFTSMMALSWAYARAEAKRLIPVEYTAFIWAAIVGWLAFGERLTLATLAGATLIIAGCLIAAWAKPDIVAHVETDTA